MPETPVNAWHTHTRHTSHESTTHTHSKYTNSISVKPHKLTESHTHSIYTHAHTHAHTHTYIHRPRVVEQKQPKQRHTPLTMLSITISV